MTALSNAIAAGDGLIQTDTALSLGSIPAPITIDSEALLVTADQDGTVYAVRRGENGTAKATHARGATVTVGWAAGTSLSEDIVAALEGAESPSGTRPYVTAGTTDAVVRLRKVTLTHAQMAAPVEGVTINTVYTLQPGDVLLLAQVLITQAFNDSAVPLFEVDSFDGSAQNVLSDPDGVGDPAVAQNGLYGLDFRTPGTAWTSLDNSVPVTPSGAAIPIQLRAGWNADGSTGSITVFLWVAEF